jgi:8-oxo-dGTP diphosphatase
VPRLPDVEELPLVSLHPEMTTVTVSAAVVERDGRFLVTRRLDGTHLEGYWEFPGGKCEAGETLEACLLRELREELAVDATVLREILTTTHAYPDRSVELRFFACDLHGEPRPQLGQDMKWITRDELRTLSLPPADAELVGLLLK